MAYLNLDDNYPDHPKVESLSDQAFRLSVSGMTCVAKFGLDGYLTKSQVSKRSGYSLAAVRELVSADLWHEIGDGCGTEGCPEGKPGHYVVHDFLHWNKPASYWDKRRKAEAKRKADWRAAKAAKEAEGAA